MNWLSRFLLFLYHRRVRKTKEMLAYWTARAEACLTICHEKHTSIDRENLVEARSKKARYQARLEWLKENAPN